MNFKEKDSILNPNSTRVNSLDLDNEIGEAMRGIASRHDPKSLEASGVESLQIGDAINESLEELDPIHILLSMEEVKKLLCDPWLEGQPVPICDE